MYQAVIYLFGFVAVGINLALRLGRVLGLSLAGTLAVIMAAVLLTADVAGAAVGFLHSLNFLFDAAAALAGLFNSLLGKLLLIFFLCSLTNRAVLKSSLGLLCLKASSEIKMENFSVSLNFSMR